jgi:hypothetical protein
MALTCTGVHAPPRAVATPRAASARATPRSDSVSPKKPQKIARNENRHRDEPENGYPWREDRGDQRVDRVYTNDNRGERLSSVYARDVAYARRGFWDWSR